MTFTGCIAVPVAIMQSSITGKYHLLLFDKYVLQTAPCSVCVAYHGCGVVTWIYVIVTVDSVNSDNA